ncbi:hypothetical protein GCK32_001725 [Trichostrongylus colubriformis]|uniref:Uncharacterized protein n=1 Tax=Trichostrongylus colubriformis TaxID=6319 RepID=A0AAN8IGQ4_TRICO
MDEDFEDLPEVTSYHRQPKKNKNKNSKSSNGYYPWFLNVGRPKFFQLYGRQYNPDVEDDKMLITEMWKAERDPYVREYKMLRGKLKGVFGALNIDEIEIEGSTRSAIRTSNDNRPPNFPLPVRACLPSFASYGSLDRHQRTVTGERDMLDRLRFFDAQKTDFASVSLQVVAVFPYTVALSTSGEVLVYPAEIAVTHYNLENGVTASFSKLINFYPKLFYGTGVPPWDQDNVESQATSLDVSLKEPQGVSPSEVWRLLMERRNYRSITICDENDIWLVDRALHFLACTAGHEELAVHRELMDAIVTAQDLIAALASHHDRVSEDSVQKILTRERINQEFKVGLFEI